MIGLGVHDALQALLSGAEFGVAFCVAQVVYDRFRYRGNLLAVAETTDSGAAAEAYERGYASGHEVGKNDLMSAQDIDSIAVLLELQALSDSDQVRLAAAQMLSNSDYRKETLAEYYAYLEQKGRA